MLISLLTFADLTLYCKLTILMVNVTEVTNESVYAAFKTFAVNVITP